MKVKVSLDSDGWGTVIKGHEKKPKKWLSTLKQKSKTSKFCGWTSLRWQIIEVENMS